MGVKESIYIMLKLNYIDNFMIFLLISLHLIGISVIITVINFICTICNQKSIPFSELPIYSRIVLGLFCLTIIIIPYFVIPITALLIGNFFGTDFIITNSGDIDIIIFHPIYFMVQYIYFYYNMPY